MSVDEGWNCVLIDFEQIILKHYFVGFASAELQSFLYSLDG